jgi:hypothetical protein
LILPPPLICEAGFLAGPVAAGPGVLNSCLLGGGATWDWGGEVLAGGVGAVVGGGGGIRLWWANRRICVGSLLGRGLGCPPLKNGE